MPPAAAMSIRQLSLSERLQRIPAAFALAMPAGKQATRGKIAPAAAMATLHSFFGEPPPPGEIR